jgi:hypothetical protein
MSASTHSPSTKQGQSAHRPSRRARQLLIFCMLSSAAVNSHAQVSLPPTNLGDTSFRDGIAGPGALLEHSLSFYRSTRLTDADGDAVPKFDQLEVGALVTHVARITDRRILGGNWGFEALLPVVWSASSPAPGTSHSRSGLGDLTVSAFILQWPARDLGTGRLWQRLNLAVTAPTGRYDAQSPMNIGSNTWVFNPHYAFTWEAASGWELSGRIHYLWPGENEQPPTTIARRSSKAGEAVHLNLSVSYEMSQRLRLGIATYALSQVSEHRIDGRELRGSREAAFGIGPGLQYQSRFGDLFINSYVETATRNRPQGAKLMVRWSFPFAADTRQTQSANSRSALGRTMMLQAIQNHGGVQSD